MCLLMTNFYPPHRVIQLKPFAGYDCSQVCVQLMDSTELKREENIKNESGSITFHHFLAQKKTFAIQIVQSCINKTRERTIKQQRNSMQKSNLQCNRLLFDGGVLWSSKPAEPPCMLKWTGPLGGYRRLMWLCNSVDSGESKLNDFMRKLSFWRRGECGAVFKRFVFGLFFSMKMCVRCFNWKISIFTQYSSMHHLNTFETCKFICAKHSRHKTYSAQLFVLFSRREKRKRNLKMEMEMEKSNRIQRKPDCHFSMRWLSQEMVIITLKEQLCRHFVTLFLFNSITTYPET